MKKTSKNIIITAIIQTAILLLAYFGVWGYTVVLAGLMGILLQAFFHLRFTGWISAVAYPVTYWISALCDTPTGGNLYVYWVFSYVGIIVISIAVDLILQNKARR